MNNARGMGMGQIAVRDGHNVVRRVFKDEAQQRDAFHQNSISRLAGYTAGSSNHTAMGQLKEWSHVDNAMMNFDDVDTKRSHPIVYTQGHGSPGVKSISSDDRSEHRVSGLKMAKQLIDMNLPTSSKLLLQRHPAQDSR